MISYRHDLEQAGTVRGGRHSLVVSSALARELERDIKEHHKKAHLERAGSVLLEQRVWHPALYRTNDKV